MSVVTDLEKGLVKLNNTTYDSVDKLMKKVAKDNDISATELHHKFKAKHNMIPDDWIKTQMQEGNLHKWFKGSKSKDGKSGWVNVVTGGTCASDKPGEGTPKCVSSAKRASMTPAERKSAQRRKKAADPNQQSKSGAAKPTYVSTDPKKKMKESTDNLSEVVGGAGTLIRQGVKLGGKKGGRAVQKGTTAATAQGKQMATSVKQGNQSKLVGDGKSEKRGAAIGGTLGAIGGALIPDGPAMVAGEIGGGIVGSKIGGKIGRQFDKRAQVKTQNEETDKKGSGSGKKDACYKKVKASASVWPSAYASGRLVQCRKKGAANYGKSKNEEFMALPEMSDLQINAMRRAGIEVEVINEFLGTAIAGTVGAAKAKEGSRVKKAVGSGAGYAIGAKTGETVGKHAGGAIGSAVGSAAVPVVGGAVGKVAGKAIGKVVGGIAGGGVGAKVGNKVVGEEVIGEKCWDGYTQKGMKKKGKKVVPNCVPVGEELGNGIGGGITGAVLNTVLKGAQTVLKNPLVRKASTASTVTRPLALKSDSSKNDVKEETIEEAVRIPAKTGNIYMVGFSWKGRYMLIKLFFPTVHRPSKQEVVDAIEKIYPGALVQRYDMATYQPGESLLHVEEHDKSSKSCSKGEYYCNDSKKCKSIPKGYHVMPNGDLMKDEDHDEGEGGDVSEGASWTKKEGQNKSGGLNEKGRKSYEKENPGSDLKAPSKKVGNKRRASFCARMKGMRKRQKPSNNTGEDRLSKSLRAWNC
jgi:hypothetical protein